MVASSLNPSETIVKLSKVPALTGFCRRTVTNWIEAGLECWYLGDTPVTTREAIARFAEPIEATTQQPQPRATTRSGDAATAHFLALK